MKKPPKKVAYLSENSVVSEIFILLPNSPNGSKHVAYRATVYRTGIGSNSRLQKCLKL